MDVFSVLDEREKMILAFRLQGYTLRQIADITDRSVETVRQSEAKALARMSHGYRDYYRPIVRRQLLEDMKYKYVQS